MGESTIGQQAVASLNAALVAKVKHYNRVGELELLQVAVDLIEESCIEYGDGESIADILARVAALGSIDAVAIMASMGCDQEKLADALRAVSERSPDVMDGMVFEGIVTLFEEWAEEEITAGRMVKSICPKTGKTLYGSAEKK